MPDEIGARITASELERTQSLCTLFVELGCSLLREASEKLRAKAPAALPARDLGAAPLLMTNRLFAAEVRAAVAG